MSDTTVAAAAEPAALAAAAGQGAVAVEAPVEEAAQFNLIILEITTLSGKKIEYPVRVKDQLWCHERGFFPLSPAAACDACDCVSDGSMVKGSPVLHDARWASWPRALMSARDMQTRRCCSLLRAA